MLVDSGRFDWEASGKFATLTAPYEGFHDMDFEEESGTRAFLLRARREGLRDFGACMAPMTAFQILQGVETLHLRMPRHVENTRKVVGFLDEQSAVETSHLSGTAGPSRPRAARRSCCRSAAARCSRSRSRAAGAAGKKFIESLRVFSHLANVGDAKSLVIHPATTTHYRMSDEDLKRAGITAGTVRLSIGLEDAAGPDRRPRPGAQGFPEVKFAVNDRPAFAYRSHELDQAHAWSSSMARAWTTHRFSCRAATSATTAGTCSRSIFPAHGRTPGSPISSVAGMAEWVFKVVERPKIEFSIVGHSMGSLIALECAREQPVARRAHRA